ncbi:trans-aconitate 2-methyltransferase [Chryseobacterium gleum]|uniref:Trans-aconitate 2-methyltransferase n=2 Tax=Chryseobacterium gleum TaxID=250 RepID=A0A3S4M1C6_CHRGE|nr:class I SAM-dependent methyltransferase [Chryseobacterium gleum]EFK36321.1 methyltransferase domain protein [Chryseobacterium gleum ATCC 35910]QQY33566.1 methyltransferase domain-containing protein [Chryseobacterium gleum]VEE08491.1 trans-aconitate 2-methyltransferase [Chryseobacterium gleum]
MISSDNKSHWENVYETKNPDQVSWTQKKPQTSLDFITSSGLGKDASIIDIGGGDSNLVDFLLEEGYENITVLDISAKALQKAQERLGDAANKVKWIATDITAFEPTEKYDIWHDRAAFHFLTKPEQVSKYIDIAEKNVNNFMIIGTFSKNGPTKCSGLDIQQYDEESLAEKFKAGFTKIKCITEDHITPFETVQNFVFCSFKKHLKIQD